MCNPLERTLTFTLVMSAENWLLLFCFCSARASFLFFSFFLSFFLSSVYSYLFVFVHLFIFIWICPFIHIYLYLFIYSYLVVFGHLLIFIYIYLYFVDLFMFIHLFIHIYLHICLISITSWLHTSRAFFFVNFIIIKRQRRAYTRVCAKNIAKLNWIEHIYQHVPGEQNKAYIPTCAQRT